MLKIEAFVWFTVNLKIPQNSQENICAEVSFAIKLPAGGLKLH